jgi:hypothetical protein
MVNRHIAEKTILTKCRKSYYTTLPIFFTKSCFGTKCRKLFFSYYRPSKDQASLKLHKINDLSAFHEWVNICYLLYYNYKNLWEITSNLLGLCKVQTQRWNKLKKYINLINLKHLINIRTKILTYLISFDKKDHQNAVSRIFCILT